MRTRSLVNKHIALCPAATHLYKSRISVIITPDIPDTGGIAIAYTQYTLNGTRGVPFGWRCPGCRKLNIGAHKVKASASYDDRGFRVNLDSRKEKAKEQMDAALEKVPLKTMYNSENRRFDKLNLTDTCAQCG